MKKTDRTRILSKVCRAAGILYKITPFAVGMFKYYPYYKNSSGSLFPFFDSIYASILLYGGVVKDGLPVDAWFQIARFCGMAATLNILLILFRRFSRLKLLNRASTVVYGNSAYADRIYDSLDVSCRIRGDSEFIDKAGKYVIMFSDDKKNIKFYSEHYSKLKDKRTYILLENVSRQNIENENVTVFSLSEICAREYWRSFPPEKSEKIALIGFGTLGEHLLVNGLLTNIIDPGQRFEYHIYGNGEDFRRLRTELDKMLPDVIVFHDDGVYTLDEISGFDRLILCAGESENIFTLSELAAYAPILPEVYVYSPNGDIVTNLFGRDKIHIFGSANKTATIDMVMNEGVIKNARRQHENYVSLHGGTEWKKLSTFKRYSNVSSADFFDVIKRLKSRGVPAETLAELEHIRWCRYHWLNNWKYGAVRDDSKRIHNDLIPYSELSREEQLKDTESIAGKLGD